MFKPNKANHPGRQVGRLWHAARSRLSGSGPEEASSGPSAAYPEGHHGHLKPINPDSGMTPPGRHGSEDGNSRLSKAIQYDKSVGTSKKEWGAIAGNWARQGNAPRPVDYPTNPSYNASTGPNPYAASGNGSAPPPGRFQFPDEPVAPADGPPPGRVGGPASPRTRPPGRHGG